MKKVIKVKEGKPFSCHLNREGKYVDWRPILYWRIRQSPEEIFIEFTPPPGQEIEGKRFKAFVKEAIDCEDDSWVSQYQKVTLLGVIIDGDEIEIDVSGRKITAPSITERSQELYEKAFEKEQKERNKRKEEYKHSVERGKEFLKNLPDYFEKMTPQEQKWVINLCHKGGAYDQVSAWFWQKYKEEKLTGVGFRDCLSRFKQFVPSHKRKPNDPQKEKEGRLKYQQQKKEEH
jgi:hypothetical protein